MGSVLFDGKRDVSREEVVNKMNYFIESAKKAMEAYQTNKRQCLELTKSIRDELEREYKNNSLKRTENFYHDNEWFMHHYRPAVHDAVASIVGRTSYKNMYSFLYDVVDYMKYHLPKLNK